MIAISEAMLHDSHFDNVCNQWPLFANFCHWLPELAMILILV